MTELKQGSAAVILASNNWLMILAHLTNSLENNLEEMIYEQELDDRRSLCLTLCALLRAGERGTPALDPQMTESRKEVEALVLRNIDRIARVTLLARDPDASTLPSTGLRHEAVFVVTQHSRGVEL